MKLVVIGIVLLVLAMPVAGESPYLIAGIYNGGAVIALQDGRAFLIRPEDREYTQKWAVNNPVSLSLNDSEYWSVILVNRESDVPVKAKPVY